MLCPCMHHHLANDLKLPDHEDEDCRRPAPHCGAQLAPRKAAHGQARHSTHQRDHRDGDLEECVGHRLLELHLPLFRPGRGGTVGKGGG